MHTPHTVSLMNSHKGSPFLVLLRGVMLQVMNGRSVQRRGNVEENRATLYVPLSVRGSGFRSLSHRDFMGGILSLGVDRAVIGDIAVLSESEALVFAAERIAPFLESELTRIGRDAVICTRLETDPSFEIPRRFEEIPVTVASLRVDGVVKALTGKSREDAAAMVRQGLAELNYRECAEVAKEVAEGDVLSVRGFGKFIIGETAGSTRSGRLRVVCRKYL